MFKTITVREKDVIGFEYNTSCGGRITVGIRYVDEDRKEKIRQDCQEPLKNRKFKFKNRLYKRMIARESIENIKNATYQDINFITEPTVQVVLDPGKSWTDLIEYDNEVKEFIVTNMIEDFSDFIDEACADVELFQKRAEAREMHNLKPGSGAQQEN
jgi:hypothetical protein